MCVYIFFSSSSSTNNNNNINVIPCVILDFSWLFFSFKYYNLISFSFFLRFCFHFAYISKKIRGFFLLHPIAIYIYLYTYIIFLSKIKKKKNTFDLVKLEEFVSNMFVAFNHLNVLFFSFLFYDTNYNTLSTNNKNIWNLQIEEGIWRLQKHNIYLYLIS